MCRRAQPDREHTPTSDGNAAATPHCGCRRRYARTRKSKRNTIQRKRKCHAAWRWARVAGNRGQAARIPVMRRVRCVAIVVSCGCGGVRWREGSALAKCVEEQQ